MELVPGSEVRVIKERADGSIATEYNAIVLGEQLPGDWFALEATWTTGVVDAHGLRFEPGDRLIEIFSKTAWYDVFHLFGPDGGARGWYANVTWPTRIEEGDGRPRVVWRDLYLDLIKPVGGEAQLVDEDELAESGLESTNSELHRAIMATMSDMRQRADSGEFPFRWPAN